MEVSRELRDEPQHLRWSPDTLFTFFYFPGRPVFEPKEARPPQIHMGMATQAAARTEFWGFEGHEGCKNVQLLLLSLLLLTRRAKWEIGNIVDTLP